MRKARSILIPYYRWTKASVKAYLFHVGQPARWLRRMGLNVQNPEKVWGPGVYWSLTMMAEKSGFWHAYPKAPHVVLVVTDSAMTFIEYCKSKGLTGSRARWIRTPEQLGMYRVDRVRYVARLGRHTKWGGPQNHPDVILFQRQVNAHRNRLKQERQAR